MGTESELKKVTAVEWLAKAIYERFGIANCGDMADDILISKEVEKQQLINAYESGYLVGEPRTKTMLAHANEMAEKHYNEKYGGSQ